jgi:hypothetical protein
LLVIQQVNKEWDINKDTMDAYVAEIRKLENKFSGLEIHHVIRDNNVGEDVLSKLGSDRANFPPGVFVHELHHPKSAEAARILRRSKGYVLVGDNLYKHGLALGILMKRVRTEEGREILQEIHEGACGNHAASCMLVRKAFQSGFYWPTALADAEELVRGVQTASSSASSSTSRSTTLLPYHLHGRSHAGVWT